MNNEEKTQSTKSQIQTNKAEMFQRRRKFNKFSSQVLKHRRTEPKITRLIDDKDVVNMVLVGGAVWKVEP